MEIRNTLVDNLSLEDHQIHVWWASLDQPVSTFGMLAETLSADEHIRAEGFRFDTDKKRFIIGRGILRTILGFYLNVRPRDLGFYYRENGKPEVVDVLGNKAIHFNLSHSDGTALYAFSRNYELGVDVECIRDIDDAQQVAERLFSKQENEVLRSLPGEKRREAFFNCWTRKEAYVKALGDGLSWPLDQFDVSLVPGQPAKLLGIGGDECEAACWSLYELSNGPAYRGALAVKADGLRISCRELSADYVLGGVYKE